MFRLYILLLFAILGFPALLMAQNCGEDEVEIVIAIMTDAYAYETGWSLSTLEDSLLASVHFDNSYPNNTLISDTVCAPANTCLFFTITDDYEDGLGSTGYYSVYYNGGLVVNDLFFGAEQTNAIACLPGIVCDNAINVFSLGSTEIYKPDLWYSFIPDSTGQYIISTCNTETDCETAIWVYSYCDDLEYTDGPEASLYFSHQGCEGNDQAKIQSNFIEGEEYFIRIGDIEDDCVGDDIIWEIAYAGPSIGCLDTTACNYQPYFEIADNSTCIYPGNPDCPMGPDLIVVQEILESSIYVEKIENDDGCYIEEQCLTGYGTREVMRFTTHIENIGDEDYYIGVAPTTAAQTQGSTQWEWDPCHSHPHYESYAEYLLYDENSNELPIGFKNGFCVMDLDCSIGGGTPKFGCGNQGISARCGDIYDAILPCQWIDITDIEEGFYTLIVRVNWDRNPDLYGKEENNYDNNWAQVCIELKRDALGDAYVIIQEECEVFTDCLGDAYGSATFDCKGICAGPNLRGDINEDSLRNTSDLNEYLNMIYDTSFIATDCNDLNADGNISITDASLLLDCLMQEAEPVGNDDLCVFPYGVTNINDTVRFELGEVNTESKYFDLNLQNPYSAVHAFQLELTGIVIDLVARIDNYGATALLIDHNESTIVGLIQNNMDLPKNNEYTSLLRVFYTEELDSMVCLSDVESVVNGQREEVITQLGVNCANILEAVVDTMPEDTSMVDTTNTTIFELTNVNKLQVFPNPFVNFTNLYYRNPHNEVFELSVYNLKGERIQHQVHLRGEYHKFERRNLNQGMYFFVLQSPSRYYQGKFVVQ